MTDIELECLNCHSTSIEGGTELRARLSHYEEVVKAARQLMSDSELVDLGSYEQAFQANANDAHDLREALTALDKEEKR